MTKENKQNLADTDTGNMSLCPCRLNSAYFPLSLSGRMVRRILRGQRNIL